MNAFESAIRYLQAGLSIIPIKADGSKSPGLDAWKEFQGRRASEREVREWFEGEAGYGVAILCGAVSGNLIVIDFDAPGYFERWSEAVESQRPGILSTLPIVKTPKGFGRHVYLRMDRPPSPGTKLAKAASTNGKSPWIVTIEFRGEGQYVVAPGSPMECSPSRDHTWEHVSGPFPEEAPILEESDWRLLLDCARSLNTYVDSSQVVGEPSAAGDPSSLPGADYCRRGDWDKLLEKHGWVKVRARASESAWRRPGKEDKGISATLGHCSTERSGPLLYVFSTNAAPFDPDRAYSLFAGYSYLEHGGDFKAAARQLAREGYGKQTPEEIRAEVHEAIEKFKELLGVMGEERQLVPKGKFDALLANDKRFKKTWDRRREEFQLDQTRYDTSLLWFARQINWPVIDQIALVYEHRRLHQSNPEQALDTPYMARLIAWLREPKLTKESDALAHTEAEGVKEGGNDNVIHEVRERTLIRDFISILQRGVEDETFFIVHAGGRKTQIGPVTIFMSYQRFKQEVRKKLRVVLPTMKNWQWDALHDLFLASQVDESYEDEGEEIEFGMLLDEYLSLRTWVFADGSPKKAAECIQARDVLVEKAQIGIHFFGLYNWTDLRYRGQWTKGRMRNAVREMGFAPQQIVRNGVRAHYQFRALAGLDLGVVRTKMRLPESHPAGLSEPGAGEPA